jgi:type III pantothenate kinase
LRLELDVGNTRIKWRLVDDGLIVKCGTDIKLDVCFGENEPEWVARIEDVWVSSVHQDQNSWIESYFSTVQYAVTRAFQCGLVNSYTDFSRMGVDRWLAMLAAREINKVGSHIVIDCGTAITLDVIDRHGQHMGGYICPGLTMMKAALLGGTNKVMAGMEWNVGRELGVDTQACVDHGIQDMVLSWLEQHIKSVPDAVVSISGGDGKKLSELLGMKNNYYPDLVLDGLNISLNNK